MKILDYKSWVWVLFQENENKYLEVFCGSVAIYSVIIKLNDLELEKYNKERSEYLNELASQIHLNSSSFKNRFISNISPRDLQEALEKFKLKLETNHENF